MSERMMGSLRGDLQERWADSRETLIGHIIGLTLAVAGAGIAGSGVVDVLTVVTTWW